MTKNSMHMSTSTHTINMQWLKTPQWHSVQENPKAFTNIKIHQLFPLNTANGLWLHKFGHIFNAIQIILLTSHLWLDTWQGWEEFLMQSDHLLEDFYRLTAVFWNQQTNQLTYNHNITYQRLQDLKTSWQLTLLHHRSSSWHKTSTLLLVLTVDVITKSMPI